jgi:hypothetical protein
MGLFCGAKAKGCFWRGRSEFVQKLFIRDVLFFPACSVILAPEAEGRPGDWSIYYLKTCMKYCKATHDLSLVKQRIVRRPCVMYHRATSVCRP